MNHAQKLIRRTQVRLNLKARSAPGRFAHGPEFYDDAYRTVDEYRLPYWDSRYYFAWTLIVDRIRGWRPTGVLEIGCGSGQLGQFLADQGVSGYLGFDFSSAAVELAALQRSGTYQVADARYTDLFGTHQYSVVICTEVLEHLEEDLSVISRIPAGKWCICTVPNFPYVSHVRYFQSVVEVASRYERFFEHFDVVELRVPGEPSMRYFVFSGRRTSQPLSA